MTWQVKQVQLANPPSSIKEKCMAKPILNIDEVSLSPRPRDFLPKGDLANRFEARIGRVADRIGARTLGYNITVIPPGKSAYPFHSHRINEEMFFVLHGNGEVRIGAETFPIRSGDFIACPPGGPEAAHQIRNTSTEELRFLAVSTLHSPEINEYPDSGKFGVYADFLSGTDGKVEYFSFQAREAMNLDYWDGEGE
jgi:uncharacterized cupin superfamily protein